MTEDMSPVLRMTVVAGTEVSVYFRLLTRLAAKVAAYNVSLYLNHLQPRPTFAFVTPFA